MPEYLYRKNDQGEPVCCFCCGYPAALMDKFLCQVCCESGLDSWADPLTDFPAAPLGWIANRILEQIRTGGQ